MKILKRAVSGIPVPKGVYIQSQTGQIRIVPRNGRILGPIGEPDYVQIPIPRCLVSILGPILGGIYFLAMPFIIVGMVICMAAAGLFRLARRGTVSLLVGTSGRGRSH
ncbi:MAG: hypothetical protein HYY65_14500 [Candidatus Tectomicrobia bacterium]|uniref:Uncharacterized protein n=1 Tax=Tectimicrobiota bacterium TaxID=2528274 RepID=A0A932GRV9_UNCTE|nr:hypothetical protein [Candidatus Tectomicrobia bacterium]